MIEPTTTLAPNEYKDANGRTWTIEISLREVRRVHGKCSINLNELIFEDLDLVRQIESDPVLFSTILYWCLEPSIKEQELTEDDFASGLFGDSLLHALRAFFWAMASFFPDPARRERMKTMLELGHQVSTMLTESAETENEKARKEVEKIKQEGLSSYLKQNRQGSAESSDGPSQRKADTPLEN